MRTVVLLVTLVFCLATNAATPVVNAVATNVVRIVSVACQCHSVTKFGNRCKRKAAPNQLYCRQHAASVRTKQSQTTCCYLDDAEVRCKAKAVEGKRYCTAHLMPRPTQ